MKSKHSRRMVPINTLAESVRGGRSNRRFERATPAVFQGLIG
jgi:hypothetical protein